MRPEPSFQIAPNWPKIGKMRMMSQFADLMLLSNFLYVAVLLLLSLLIAPSFMLIWLLVLEL